MTALQEFGKSMLPILELADSLPFPDGYKLLAELKGMEIGQVFGMSGEGRVNHVREKMQKVYTELKKRGILDESNGMAG